jgi:hypothetical protein
LLPLLLLGASASLRAQDPMALYFMETVPQTSRINPAFQPRANGFVSLPASVGVDFRSGLSVKDIFQKHGDRWYLPIERQYDYKKLYKSIGRKATMINARVEWDLLGFGFRTGKGYVTFGVSEHVVGVSSLPSDLFKISETGFPDNTRLDFSPMRIHAMAYKQILIGYSHPINEKLTIGVNLKPLFGQVAATTKIRTFSIKTGLNEWSVEVEGDAYTSLPATMTEDEDGDLKEFEFQDDLETADYISKYAGFSNPGFAVDLGAVYAFTERLSVSAALNNLGFISWKQDLNGVSFRGQYAFKGIEYNTADDDDIDNAWEALGDSLKNVIYFGTQHKKFKTALTPSLYLGASYRLTPAISVGLLSRSVFWKKAFHQSFNLSLNLQPYSFVSFNIGINTQIKGNTYFGTGFSLFLGPLQFYLISDYLPIRYSTLTLDGDKIPFVPERQKEITIRTGLNLVFGKHGYVNSAMLEKRANQWK